MKVKMFSNECRQLKRKLNWTPQHADFQYVSSNYSDRGSTLLTALFPAAKWSATKRMVSTSSSQDIVRQFPLDRQKIGLKSKNNLQQQVEKYFHRDDVSIVTPDLKKS